MVNKVNKTSVFSIKFNAELSSIDSSVFCIQSFSKIQRFKQQKNLILNNYYDEYIELSLV